MASEELPEPVEEKIAAHEAVDLQAINGSISTENVKEQMEIKSYVIDGKSVNEDKDMIKEEVDLACKLGISVESNQIITKKPEGLEKCSVNLGRDLTEQEIQRHEEISPPVEETNAEKQDKVNGETDNELHSTQFTEELLPEVVKGDGISENGENGIPFLSEEIKKKTDSEEVIKEEVHENQIPKEDKTGEDVIQQNIVTNLSDKDDHQKETEVPITNASQNPEEVVTNEGIHQIEDVKNMQVHQIEAAEENLADRKECLEETEEQSIEIPVPEISEETIREEESHENQNLKMTHEEIEQTEDTKTIVESDETRKIDHKETNHDEDPTSCAEPATSEEASNRDVAESATPLILEEAKESEDIKEDTKEEAHQNQLPDNADTEANASEDQIKDDEKINTKEPHEMEKKVEDEEKTEKNLLDNIEHEAEPSIQNEIIEQSQSSINDEKVASGDLEPGTESDVPLKSAMSLVSQADSTTNSVSERNSNDSMLQNGDELVPEVNATREVQISEEGAVIEEQSAQGEPKNIEIEGSTEVTEDPRDVQDGASEISYEQDQFVPEDGMKLTLKDDEIEAEKPQICDTSIHREEEDSIILQNNDGLEFEEKTDKSKDENLAEKLEEVEEPSITQNKQELPEAENKIENKENSNDSDLSTTQQDQQCLEPDAKPTEENATDAISEEEESQTNVTLISSTEQIEERAIAKEEAAIIQEENTAVETTKEETQEQLTDKKIEEDQEVKSQPESGEVTKLEPSQSETVDPETENLTVLSNEKLDDKNKPAELDAISAELENAADDSSEQKEASVESDNTRELQIHQKEVTVEQNQPNQELEVESTEPEKATDKVSTVEDSQDNPTLSANVEEQIGEAEESIANEENISLKEEKEDDVVEVPKEEAETIDAVDEKQIEELPQAENTGKGEEASEDSNIPTIQQDSQCQDSDVKLTDANQATDVIPEKEDSETNVTSISDIAQNVDRSIALEGATAQEENSVAETPREETEAESTKKQIEEIPDPSDVQDRTSERSYEHDQFVPEVAEQDGLKLTLKDDEIEAEKPQICDTSIHGEEENSVMLQNDDETELEEKINDSKAENLAEKLEKVEEPSITQNKQEMFEAENTIENKEGSNDSDVNITQQDQQCMEPDGKLTEENPADAISDVEGSHTNVTLISSTEQIEERSIAKEEAAVIQEENTVVETPKEETQGELTEKKIEEVEEVKSQPESGEVTEVELSQSEIVDRETENLTGLSNKELDDKNKPAEVDAISTELKNAADDSLQQKEVSIEPDNTRELQIDLNEFTVEQNQPNQELEVEPTELEKATDEVSAVEDSQDKATLSANVEEQIGEAEESIANEKNVSSQEEKEDVLVEVSKEEAETIDAANEKQIEELTQAENSGKSEEASEDSNIPTIQQDQQCQDSDVKLTDANQATDVIPEKEGSETNATSISDITQNDDRSIALEGATAQEENSVAETPREETEAESTKKQIEEIPEISDPSVVNGVELSQTVAPETENMEVATEEKTHSELAELESTTDKSMDQKEILIESDNTREEKIKESKDENLAEKPEEVEEPSITQNKQELPKAIENKDSSNDSDMSTTRQDQQCLEPDAKPTEENLPTDAISEEKGSDTNVTLISSTEQMEERSIAKEEVTIIQEENTAGETPKEKTQRELTDKEIEEVKSQPESGEGTKVELSQRETVHPETEKLVDVSNKKLDGESESAVLDATDESSEQKEVSIEPHNTREVQIDQNELTAEQNQPNQESEIEPMEPEKATDEVTAVEDSQDNATVSASVDEQIGEAEESIAIKENVSLQEKKEDAVVEVAKEEAETTEATNEKRIAELPQAENTVKSEEASEDSSILAIQQDQQCQDSNVKLTDENQATDVILEKEGLETNVISISDTTQNDDRSIVIEEQATTEEENSVVEIPTEEMEAESTEKQIEETPEIVDPSEVTGVELSQNETVAPETENMEVATEEKLHSKSAELESTTDQSACQKEISIEPDNTREMQILQTEISAEEDQANQESEVTPIKSDQAADDVVPAAENSEDNVTSSSGVEQIVEAEGSVVSDESVVFEEEDAHVEMPKEETRSIQELSKAIENKESSNDSDVSATQRDEQCLEPDAQQVEENPPTTAISEEEVSDTNVTLISSTEQIEETSFAKEEAAIIQEENNAGETPKEETLGGLTDKEIQEVKSQPESGEVTEVELSQSEIVQLETEKLVDLSNEKLDDESEPAKLDAIDVSSEQKEVSIEHHNTREFQIDQNEFTAEQNQPNQESEVELKEAEKATDQVSVVEDSHDNATLNASVDEQIGEVGESFTNEENVSLQDEKEDAIVDVAKDEAETTEVANEKQIEELPQAENTVKSEVASEDSSIPAIQQDQQCQDSDVKLSDANQATDVILEKEGLEANATSISDTTQNDDRSIVIEERETTQEENSVVQTPTEETEAESTKKQIEKILEIADPSEVTVVELSQNATVAPETENMEVATEEKTQSESAELESTTDESTDQKEISIEPDNTREMQIHQTEISAEQDQATRESEVTPIKSDQATDAVDSTAENSEDNVTCNSGVEQIVEAEGSVANDDSVVLQEEDAHVEMPKEETRSIQELSKAIENKESSNGSDVSATQQDQQCLEPDSQQVEENPPTNAISEEEVSDTNVTLISSTEQIEETSFAKEEAAIIQEENSVVETSKEETLGELTDKEIQEVKSQPESGEVTEVEFSQSETMHPETEKLVNVSNEKLDDESEPAVLDATDESSEQKEVSIEHHNTREFQVDQNEFAAEQNQPNQESEVEPTETEKATDEVSVVEDSHDNATLNASVDEQIREVGESIANEENVSLEEEKEDAVVNVAKEEVETTEAANEKQIEELPRAEITVKSEEASEDSSIPAIQQDQQCEDFDVKLTGGTQATDVMSEKEGLEANATSISDTTQNDDRSIVIEERETTQEENSLVETPTEETEAESTKKQIEKIPEIADPSEVTVVELSQNETVASETENVEVAIEEKIHSESAELESTTDESTDQKEISIESDNTREMQIHQTEISAEQDQATRDSEVMPIKSDQTTNAVDSAAENSEDNVTSSSGVEQIVEAEGSVANDDSVVLQEEDAHVKMPKEETRSIQEVPQIAHQSELTEEEQVVESEVPFPEAENSEIISDEKVGDECKLSDTELRSDQMKSVVDEVIEGKMNADLSSSVEQLKDISEENEGSLQSTEELVKEERSDAIKEDDEPSEKHIDGEIHRTAGSEVCNAADEESKAALTEKEASPQICETQTELPEQEKEESALVEESSDTTAPVVPGEGQIEKVEITNKEDSALPRSSTELPLGKIIQGVETNKELSEKDTAGEISDSIHPSENTEVQLGESGTLLPETEQSEIVPNEKLGHENKLDETAVKSAQTESTSDELIEEILNANLSSSVEPTNEKSDESEVIVLQSIDKQAQGEKLDSEIPKEATSQGVETDEDRCDKHTEREISLTTDPEICSAADESKKDDLNAVTEKEVAPQNFGTETESTEQEKTPEENVLVEEKSDATASIAPAEGQVDVGNGNQECSFVPQSTTVSMTVSEERIPQEVDASDEQSDKDTTEEVPKMADPKSHDVAVQSENMFNEKEVDSEILRTEIKSPNLENVTKESPLTEQKSDDAPNLVHDYGKIEEIEKASKESSVAPQSTIEQVTVPEEEVSREAETNEEPIDKHVVGEQSNTSVDDTEVSEEIQLVQEDNIDKAQTTASLVEQSDSKNVGTVTESAFLENTNDDIDVKSELDATSVASIVEEEGTVVNQTDNGSENIPVVEQTHAGKTKLTDENIPSDVPEDTVNNIETEEQQVKEYALETAVSEPEDQTTDEALSKTESQEISGQVKDIANITFEAVSGELNTETNLKGVDQHMENAADQEAIVQTERDVDVTELLKAAEQKVTVDENNEDTQEAVPNFSEPSKEVEEANQPEEQEQDFASIVSSFLINKVLSEENQKIDDGMKQNNDASIPKTSTDENIQETATTKTEPETGHEEMSYSTSSKEELKSEIHEPEEENGEKAVEEKDEENDVEQDYLPVSRFLMDKILRQEENRQEEKALEETDKDLISDGGLQVEEKIEKISVLAPEQKGETTSYFAEFPRDSKGETLIEKADNNFDGDATSIIEEKVEANSNVPELTKLEVVGSHSPIELTSDFEKKEKPAEARDEAPELVEDKNETLVSDVGIPTVERNEGPNNSGVIVAEQEAERNISAIKAISHSPIEMASDFEKEEKPAEAPKLVEDKNETLVSNVGISSVEKNEGQNNSGIIAAEQEAERNISAIKMIREKGGESIEQKNEAFVTDEGQSVIEKTKETSEWAIPEQGGKTLYPVEVVRDFGKDKKLVEEKDVISVDGVSTLENTQGGNSKVALVEEVKELAYREHSEDLVDEPSVNAQQFSNPEKLIEENRAVMDDEGKVIAHEETPKDVKNVEENYVFVEPEDNLIVEPKEILKEEIVTDDATISNLEEKQTNFSAETHDEKTNIVGQVQITEKGMKSSSVNCQEIEQSPSDIPKGPMATEMVKELVGETDVTHEEEKVKEFTGKVVERVENRSQENLAEVEATKMEKKNEEIENEEHEEEEEEEEEKHQERETEMIGRDLAVKAEAREKEMKSEKKKSQNILSGVGSKVKHSWSKVKKVITGKSKNVSPLAK